MFQMPASLSRLQSLMRLRVEINRFQSCLNIATNADICHKRLPNKHFTCFIYCQEFYFNETGSVLLSNGKQGTFSRTRNYGTEIKSLVSKIRCLLHLRWCCQEIAPCFGCRKSLHLGLLENLKVFQHFPLFLFESGKFIWLCLICSNGSFM